MAASSPRRARYCAAGALKLLADVLIDRYNVLRIASTFFFFNKITRRINIY